MFAIKDKFPGAGYTDLRVEAPPATGLDANLGRLPVLDVTENGVTTTIGQSKGIWAYVASELGLLGSTPLETAQVWAFVEHISELMAFYSKHVPWGSTPTEETFAALFDDDSASDFAGPAVGATQSKRNVRWYAGRLERIVGDGFAVGGKLTLADVLIYYRFGDSLPEEGHEKVAKAQREPFGSLERTQKLLATHPRLAKIVDSVAAIPSVQKWKAIRKNTF